MKEPRGLLSVGSHRVGTRLKRLSSSSREAWRVTSPRGRKELDITEYTHTDRPCVKCSYHKKF